MSDWLRQFYDRVDQGGWEAVADLVADDLVFQLANKPPVRGRDTVISAEREFSKSIQNHTHRLVHTFHDGDTAVMEAIVTYTRLDGSTLDVPCATVLHRTGDLVDSIRVYIDDCAVLSPTTVTARVTPATVQA